MGPEAEFRRRLRHLVLAKYGSLDRFYLETNFSKGHLSQILRGDRSPSLATIVKLAGSAAQTARLGGTPFKATAMMREAMSHEEFSVGFWPGSGAVREPAFYAYAAPEPPGFSSAPVRPSFALYRHEISNFILPYERVRTMAAPDDVVLDFFQAAYAAAADLGAWDRLALDRPEHEWP